MSRHWSEPYDSSRHHAPMGLEDAPRSRDEKLDPRPVYFVRVRSFTFEFHSIAQIETCRAFFSQKVRPSSRLRLAEVVGTPDRMDVQNWHDRLPMWLLEEPKRAAVLKALDEALEHFRATRA